MLGGVSTIAVRLQTWVEVLVDCPGAQGLYTYQLAADLEVSPGDILSVPFGSQQLGAIAVRLLSELPQQLRSSQIRTVDTFVAGFFSPAYWQLLERLAAYYQTPLIQVIRTALPPGLLAKSKRRVRLVLPPPTSSISLSGSAQQLLSRLQQSPTGDYSWQYLQQQSRSAYRDLQQLLQQGWVESYLATPQPPRPKQQQAVSVIVHANSVEGLTRRQQEILALAIAAFLAVPYVLWAVLVLSAIGIVGLTATFGKPQRDKTLDRIIWVVDLAIIVLVAYLLFFQEAPAVAA
ncbi:MAG: hypothetical protein HC886_24120 [Leptolyngbyaceae cyanobacterium SM1_1_3]|nr:hypothetical protein [Leptolyngbyaceae cyanobacterium SM1_1_3]